LAVQLHRVLSAYLLRAQSRGQLTLNSAGPLIPPNIDLGFYSNGLDLVAIAEGVQFVGDVIMNGDGMKDLVTDDYPWPLPRDDDAMMRQSIFERSSTRSCEF
jgi:choline dehydrogenase